MTFSRLAAAMAAVPAPIVPATEAQATVPDIPAPFTWGDMRSLDDLLADIDNLPSSDAKTLASYVYMLYLKIFEDVTGDIGRNPVFAKPYTSFTIKTSLETALAQSVDPLVRSMARAFSENTSDRFELLEKVALRTGLLRAFPRNIFYLVLAVYSNTSRDFTPSDEFIQAVMIPNNQGMLTYYEGIAVTSISNIGIGKDLPKFWKWMYIIFRSAWMVDGEEVAPDINKILPVVLDVLMRSGRTLAPVNMNSPDIRGKIRTSVANVMAMMGVAYRLMKSDRDQSKIFGSIMHTFSQQNMVCVDAAYAETFLRQVLRGEVNEELLLGCGTLSNFGSFYLDFATNCSNGDRLRLSNCMALETFSLALEAEGEDLSELLSDDVDEEVSLDADALVEDEADPAPSEDLQDPQNTEDVNNYIASDLDAAEGSTISLITLAADDEGITPFIYRHAVLRAAEEFELRPELGIDPEKLTVLRDWCLRWLWLADIEDTKQLLHHLGLKNLFETIPIPK